MHRPTSVSVVTLAICCSVASLRAQSPFIGLGSSTTRATAVSADGSTVVGLGPGGGFRWTTTDGAAPGVAASGMSRDGSVVVGTTTVGDHTEAFRWTQSGGTTPLGVLPDTAWSRGVGVSGDGSTAVGNSGISGDDYVFVDAFRWTQSTGMTRPVPGGEDGYFTTNGLRSANAASHDGAVVVGSLGEGAQYDEGSAFRWKATGNFEVLNGLTSGRADALAVSGDGQFTVGTSLVHYGFIDANVWEPVVWTNSATPVGLGLLPLQPIIPDTEPPLFPFQSFAASAVSDDGSVIVGFSTYAKGINSPYSYFNTYNASNPNELNTSGFLWTTEDGLRNFRDVLLDDYALGNLLVGWNTLNPYAMSPDGRYIAGWGYHNGVEEAFLFDRLASAPPFTPVPEPATYGLWGVIGLVGVLLHRRMRRRLA